MDRTLNAATLGAVRGQHVPYLFFVQMAFSQPVRLCTAPYNVEWAGQTWVGMGSLGGIDPMREQAALEATGVRITLSGIPTDTIALALGEQYQGKALQIWFAPLTDDLRLVSDPVRIFTGRMDTMDVELDVTASISLSAESKMVTWDTPRVRRYNHEDQQVRFPGDRGFEFVAQMVEKQLVWGR